MESAADDPLSHAWIGRHCIIHLDLIARRRRSLLIERTKIFFFSILAGKKASDENATTMAAEAEPTPTTTTTTTTPTTQTVGYKTFANAEEAKSYFRHILTNYSRRQDTNAYEFQNILSLVERGHPNAVDKLKGGVTAIQIRERRYVPIDHHALSVSLFLSRLVSHRVVSVVSVVSVVESEKQNDDGSLTRSLAGNGRRVDGRSSACFHLIKADGKVEDVSYLKCVQGLFPGERVEEEADAAADN